MVRHDVVEELRVLAELLVVLAEPSQGVDTDPRPFELGLEVVGRAVLAPVVAADVDEDAPAAVVEEVADDQLFVELRVALGVRAQIPAPRLGPERIGDGLLRRRVARDDLRG